MKLNTFLAALLLTIFGSATAAFSATCPDIRRLDAATSRLAADADHARDLWIQLYPDGDATRETRQLARAADRLENAVDRRAECFRIKAFFNTVQSEHRDLLRELRGTTWLLARRDVQAALRRLRNSIDRVDDLLR